MLSRYAVTQIQKGFYSESNVSYYNFFVESALQYSEKTFYRNRFKKGNN